MSKQVNIRFTLLLIIIFLIGLWRVLTASDVPSIWANFSPVGALALFGGTYFSRRYTSYLFPLLILLISDVILMQTIFAEYSSGLLYDGWVWNYGSFVLMVWIGEKFKKRVSFLSILITSILAGLVHFIFSNFGVWMNGGIDLSTSLPYAKNWSGLLSCYLAAVPYFRNLLFGNLFFGALLFGGFELAQFIYPKLQFRSIVE